MEAALKMVFQARVQRSEAGRTLFVSLGHGYHGDTTGAMSVGHSATFHRAYRPLLFDTQEVMSPACYRCPHNQAEPVRGSDARTTRKCRWECLGELERALNNPAVSAFVLEPRVQGAAGMLMHPERYLEMAAALCRERGVWLVLDEVMTGFGRTGTMFAFQRESNVTPRSVGFGQGPDRRLSAGRRDAGRAGPLRCVSRRVRGSEDVLSMATATPATPSVAPPRGPISVSSATRTPSGRMRR